MKMGMTTMAMGSGGGCDCGWNPLLLPNILGWWDAKDPASITKGYAGKDVVSAWIDKARVRTITGSEAYGGTYDSVNETVVFNGSQVLLIPCPVANGSGELGIVLIADIDTLESSDSIFTHSGSVLWRLYAANATDIYLRGNQSDCSVSTVAAVRSATQRIYYAYYSTANSTKLSAYKCGGTVESPTDLSDTGVAQTTTFNSANAINFMAGGITGANGTPATVKGLILLNGSISDPNMTLLLAYLRTYYNVA